MGIAIALGLRRSNPNISIAIIDSDPEKYKNISGANISLLAGLPDAPTFEAMILAIPPQAFNSFSHNNPQLKSLSTLMISVMAGITISELEKYLKYLTSVQGNSKSSMRHQQRRNRINAPSNYHAKKQIISHPNSFTAWHVNHDARRESY